MNALKPYAPQIRVLKVSDPTATLIEQDIEDEARRQVVECAERSAHVTIGGKAGRLGGAVRHVLIVPQPECEHLHIECER
ncbi:hypothetical protein J6590_032785 [Homalodisca vitripennis]|nr:hypothetical protein J6590_032785 [Homalodisca vitripennis]